MIQATVGQLTLLVSKINLAALQIKKSKPNGLTLDTRHYIWDKELEKCVHLIFDGTVLLKVSDVQYQSKD